MKLSHISSLLFFIFTLLFQVSSNVECSDSEILTKEELNNDLERISYIKEKSKIVACMSLVRNTLSEENKNIKNALEGSEFNRSISFEKIILAILNNCKNNINDAEIEILLNPDNILTFVSENKNYTDLIKFDKNILKNLNLNSDESFIKSVINTSLQNIESDYDYKEEELRYLSFEDKLYEWGKGLNLFISITVVMIIFIFCGGLYMLLCQKKSLKDKKKKNN